MNEQIKHNVVGIVVWTFMIVLILNVTSSYVDCVTHNTNVYYNITRNMTKGIIGDFNGIQSIKFNDSKMKMQTLGGGSLFNSTVFEKPLPEGAYCTVFTREQFFIALGILIGLALSMIEKHVIELLHV